MTTDEQEPFDDLETLQQAASVVQTLPQVLKTLKELADAYHQRAATASPLMSGYLEGKGDGLASAAALLEEGLARILHVATP